MAWRSSNCTKPNVTARQTAAPSTGTPTTSWHASQPDTRIPANNLPSVKTHLAACEDFGVEAGPEVPGGERKWLMDNRFEIAVAAGTMRSDSDRAVRFPHRWTPEGVTVEADFTGGHLLHLAVAGCVLNDVYREGYAKLSLKK